MKSKNKKISGISLITLIITIAVVIILIAAIIIGLGKNNSIDTSRVTKVLSNRDHIESNIKLYVSNVQSETKNYFTPVQIIAGNVPRRTYTINEILKNGTIDYRIAKCVEVMIEKNSVQKMVYRIDEEKYKEKMGQDIPEVPDVKNSAWYVDSEGTVYLAFNNKDNIPKYIKGDAQGDTLSENSLMDEYLIITDIDVCEEFNIADIDDP